jgi:Zn-dependent M16 (insulinase) family peptidase
VGELISPVPPRLRGQYTLLRELSGLDYALRQQIRNQLFEIKPLELSNMAEELLARWEDSAWVSVVGPEIWAKDPIPDSRDFEE